MRNVSDKSCKGNQNTHLMLKKKIFFENHAVYEIMWKNTVERDHRWQYDACAFRAGYLGLQMLTQFV